MAGLTVLVDVNVLVANYNTRHMHHPIARNALNDVFEASDLLGLSSVSLSGAIRILSFDVYRDALSDLADVTRYLSALRASPATVMLEPGDRLWNIFSTLIASGRFGYKKTTDVWFAALALEHDATLMTFDGGFAEFDSDGLRWRHLST